MDLAWRSPGEAGSAVHEMIPDVRPLMAALRPLGDNGALVRRAAEDPAAFERLCALFLATAAEEYDPVYRLVDGVNHSLYRLAKAVLGALPLGPDDFAFDRAPDQVETAAREAQDRLEALVEYTDGRTTDPADQNLVEQVLGDCDDPSKLGFDLVETLLRRSIAIGGRYGLDAANLLGFLCYKRGDLESAEMLFRTVIEHPAQDTYERETQAHAMNNLTGVHVGRGDLQFAILWCERSLMLKERLGLDARTNHVNLLFLWLDQGTPFGVERARHYLRTLIAADGKADLERALHSKAYRRSLQAYRRAGLDKEFPEVRVPEEASRQVQKHLDG